MFRPILPPILPPFGVICRCLPPLCRRMNYCFLKVPMSSMSPWTFSIHTTIRLRTWVLKP